MRLGTYDHAETDRARERVAREFALAKTALVGIEGDALFSESDPTSVEDACLVDLFAGEVLIGDRSGGGNVLG
jgi:hypothetical protein